MTGIDWSRFDGVETSSNRYFEEEDCWERVDDVADAKHISQHSLYLHCKAGGVECYADFPGDAMGLYMCDALARTLLDLRTGLREQGHVNFTIDRDEYMEEQKMDEQKMDAMGETDPTKVLTEVERKVFMREVMANAHQWSDTGNHTEGGEATEWYDFSAGDDHGKLMALALYLHDQPPAYYLYRRPWIVWFELLLDGAYLMHHSQWDQPRKYRTRSVLIDDLIKQQNEGDFSAAVLAAMLRALTFSHWRDQRIDRGDYP